MNVFLHAEKHLYIYYLFYIVQRGTYICICEGKVFETKENRIDKKEKYKIKK